MLPKFQITICLVLLIGVCGCARLKPAKNLNYRTVESVHTDSKLAKRKYERALGFLSNCRYKEAEQCLQESLLADKSFGPAHNALGKVYYDQNKFYLAAWEFEHAIKSMPTRAEPFNNLGLVYESVGQLEGAIEQYTQASEMVPENAQYLGNLLRARIRRGDDPLTMREQLENLIFLDDRQSWVDWARKQIVFAERTDQRFQSDSLFSGSQGEMHQGYGTISNELPGNSNNSEVLPSEILPFEAESNPGLLNNAFEIEESKFENAPAEIIFDPAGAN